MAKPKNKTNKQGTIERIQEVWVLASIWFSDMLAPERNKLHVTVSEGNSKIGKSLNVSTMPVVTCGALGHICGVFCYAVRALVRLGFKGDKWKKNPWVINSLIAMYDPHRYFAEIKSAIKFGISRPKKPIKYFRWHVGGEILHLGYFERMVDVAKEFADVRFLAFTKRYDIVNLYMNEHDGRDSIPANLSIIFSAAPGQTVPNPYHLPECHINMEEEKLNNVWRTKYLESQIWHCLGNCEKCQCIGAGCWFLKDGTIVLIDQH